MEGPVPREAWGPGVPMQQFVRPPMDVSIRSMLSRKIDKWQDNISFDCYCFCSILNWQISELDNL